MSRASTNVRFKAFSALQVFQGDMRSEPRPGRGTVGLPKPSPLPRRSLRPPIGTVTYLAGTACSQGSRAPEVQDTASGPRFAARPRVRGVTTLPWAGSNQPVSRGMARVSSNSFPPRPGESRPSLPSGRGAGLRDESRAHAWVGGGKGSGLCGWGFWGARRCSGPPSAASVAPRPSPDSLSESDRAERSRGRVAPWGAAAWRGSQRILSVQNPWGTLAPSSCGKASWSWVWSLSHGERLGWAPTQ